MNDIVNNDNCWIDDYSSINKSNLLKTKIDGMLDKTDTGSRPKKCYE